MIKPVCASEVGAPAFAIVILKDSVTGDDHRNHRGGITVVVQEVGTGCNTVLSARRRALVWTPEDPLRIGLASQQKALAQARQYSAE